MAIHQTGHFMDHFFILNYLLNRAIVATLIIPVELEVSVYPDIYHYRFLGDVHPSYMG